LSPVPARIVPHSGVGATLAISAIVILLDDASSWFSRLPLWAAAAIALSSLVWLAGLAAAARRRSRPAARAVLVLTISILGLLALSGNRLARAARVSSLARDAESRARIELDERAAVIQSQFADLIARSTSTLDAARPMLAEFDGGPAIAFELIDEVDAKTRFTSEGGGLCLYDRARRPVAWAGSSYPATEGLLNDLPEDAVTFRVEADEHLTRLYGLLARRGLVFVTETTIISRLDPRRREQALPAMAGEDASALKLQDFREPETGLADLLARKDDKYPGGATGERQYLFVGLRSPDHSYLGYARLRGPAQSDMRRRIDGQHREAAAAVLALWLAGLLLACLLPRSGDHARGAGQLMARLAGGLGLLWGGRLLLSWFPLESTSWGFGLFDSTLFASAGFFHLMRSPADLLATALTALGSATLLSRALGRLASLPAASARPAAYRAAGWLLLISVGTGTALLAPSAARGFVGNAATNLLEVAPLQAPVATLVLQVSALTLLLSVFLALQAAGHLVGAGGGRAAAMSRMLPRPGDGLSRWALGVFLPGILLATVLYDPLLSPRSRLANENLFEDQLMPLVLSQSENRRDLVRATIDALEAMPTLPDRIQEAGPSSSSLALDLWLRTPLKDSGYNASLLVSDADGRTISRFARNLPPAFDRRAPETYAPPGEPTMENVSFLNLTKKIWHADHYVVSGDRFAGTVTVHMLDDFDNIPFLIAERPYARALAPQVRHITTLPPGSGGVRHAVYDRHGHPVFWNQREAPPLPSGWTNLLVSPGKTQWRDLTEEDRPARYLYFSDGDHVFALGFMEPDTLERVARTMRLGFVGLLLLCALLVPAAMVQERGQVGAWWRRIMEALGRTHYRKLLATFTAATLFPLLLLSALMSGYITRGLDSDIEDRGRQAIQSASSLVRTILETEEKAKPDDDTMYWLSLLVGEDVNLYERGELVATSRPELFGSGLLSPRIDGAVYRRLALGGGRVAMGEKSLKGEQYRTITATVVANEGQWEGLLSLPLDAQAAEARLAAREVADAMIITFAGMVVLMGGVGYVLARRVSRPIRSLREAAARIAGGDFDAVVQDRPRDETGDLIASFNRMALAIKQQREDLERRRDYIEKILLNATIGVISMNNEGRVVTANPAARSILDLPTLEYGEDLPAMITAHPSLGPLAGPLADHRPGRDAPPSRPASASHASHEVQLTIPAEPGDRTVRARFVPFLEGQGVILLLEDVTETVRSNRLAAWAEMARRIAHEIKNPLTPIQLSTEHLRRVYEERSPDFPVVMEECLRTIMGAVADLRQISAEFSTYARIPAPRKELAGMSVLIEEVARPYRTAPPPGVRIEVDVPANLPRLSVDRSLISRALVNLIENALQAMPRGGTLSLRARVEGDHLAIDVVDTGIGMDPAALAKIFEPYFSTKDSGMGLGLAIARKAVEEHGGRIDVISAPGKGTTMRMLLPILPGQPGSPENPAPAEPAAARGIAP